MSAKTYVGKRYEESNVVVVVAEGEKPVRLSHHVQHSPDGFNWGYGGSGPAELARCLLWDLLGEEPEVAIYQGFKREIIAAQTKDAFCLTSTEISCWLEDWVERGAEDA